MNYFGHKRKVNVDNKYKINKHKGNILQELPKKIRYCYTEVGNKYSNALIEALRNTRVIYSYDIIDYGILRIKVLPEYLSLFRLCVGVYANRAKIELVYE